MADRGRSGSVREPPGGQGGSFLGAEAASGAGTLPKSAAGGVLRAPARWRTAAGRAVFILALLVSVTLRGGVGPVTLLITVALFGVALFLGALTPPGGARARRALRLCLAVAFGLVLYLLFQSWSFADNPFASPLWHRVDHLLGTDITAISVAPAVTRSAIFTVVAPFLVYAGGLVLFQRDEGGVLLLRWLNVLGVAFAVFGLLQLTFFPDRLLFVAKTNYLESLTGFFVNRNTAGTFLGIASFAALTLLVCPETHRGRSISAMDVFGDWSASGSHKLGALAKLLGLFAIILALFLTRSRGALLATVLAYATAYAPYVSQRSRGSSRGATAARRTLAGTSRPLLAGAGVAVAILVVVALFGELAIYRMATQGVDDARLCVYASTLKAIGENWRFGTGFGTFESVFPIYREAGCGSFGSIFLRAHNIYLEGGLGLGLPFLPLLIGGFAHVVGNLRHGLRRRRRMRPASAAGLGAVALVALHGLVDFSLQIPGMAAYLAAYLAAATTISLGGGAPESSSHADARSAV